MMKNFKIYGLMLVSAGVLALGSGCNKWLEVPPLDKMTSEQLLNDEASISMLLANLYNQVPMEDFNYRPEDNGFNRRSWSGNQTMFAPSMYTDESNQSQGSGIGPGTWAYWNSTMDPNPNNDRAREEYRQNGRPANAYRANRDVSVFLESIASALDQGILTEAKYNRLVSEAHFVRAYIYFQLAKRYGGVPIIDKLQDNDYFTGGAEALKVPRSTETNTWKFILAECDKAAEHLPTKATWSDPSDSPIYRATKWAALALKSRAALYAASLAKHGGKVSFSGEAATQGLVGIPASEAAFFYGECLSASDAIIKSGEYAIYGASPANPEEAAKNYQELFMNTAGEEVIFGKKYISGVTDDYQGHFYDNFYTPNQRGTGFRMPGRFSVTLNMVDLYEDYTDNSVGASAPIVTRTDGNENSYISTNTPTSAQIAAIPFVKYDNPYDAFKNKDARLLASVLVPGSKFNDVTMIMQGGLIDQNGDFFLYQDVDREGKDGRMYNSYGGNVVSGFRGMNNAEGANYSSTGFSIRKYLQEQSIPAATERSSSTSWIDFRLAEIYLNYAEAQIESGSGNASEAEDYINALRKRAGHTDRIPLTLANVLKERRVELAFENFRMNDQFRRREYHEQMQNFRRHALVQLVDLREDTPKYVFLRMEQFHDIIAGGRTFQTNNYYFNIVNASTSGIINNPGRN